MTIPSWMQKGAQCVCIKRTPWAVVREGFGDNRHPAFGEVCVIEGVSVEMGMIALDIRGYSSLLGARHFRPVVTEQDDLEAHFNQFLHHTTPAIPEGV